MTHPTIARAHAFRAATWSDPAIEAAAFVAAHDDVLEARYLWRGAASRWSVTVQLPHWITTGEGSTLEEARANVSREADPSGAMLGLIEGMAA